MFAKVGPIRLSLRLGFYLLLAAMFILPQFVSAQSDMEVIATGLNNPRHLSFGPEGALYVAEAGTGGDDCFSPSPDDPEFELCVGGTGSITRIWRGEQERVATGLPSLADPSGMGATGPTDISFLGRGNAQINIGLGASPQLRDMIAAAFDIPLMAKLGYLVQMPASGKWRYQVDISAYELKNPDGGEIDSNPYAVLALPGKTIVADAGGNDLIQINANNRISTLAVFPDREVPLPPLPPGPPFDQFPDPFPMQAVPTGVVLGPDGAYYVSQLTGFPFPVGEANVYRVPAGGGEPEVYASGLTAVVDLTFGPDGSLYVVEIAKNGLLQAELGGDFTGAVIRIAPDGSQYEVASEGLIAPGGVAFGPDGALYVTNFSVFPEQGQVVRISDVMGTPIPESASASEATPDLISAGNFPSWLLHGFQRPDLRVLASLFQRSLFLPVLQR